MRLTLTELPVLGDHLAVAAVALAGVGAIAVYTAALPFTWVLVTLIHIYNRRKESKGRGSTIEIECDITLQLHFTSRDCSISKPCLWGSSTAQTFLSDGPEPSRCRAEAAAKASTVR